MDNKKKQILNAVMVIISAIAIQLITIPPLPKKGDSNVECFGINSCKGSNGCNVSNEQIKYANQVYKNKFTKSVKIECSGMSDCSADKGFLAWISKNNEKECIALGGFIFEKNADKTLSIKDKSGKK